MRNDFESNYLAHFGIKKGGTKAGHLYVARVELGEKNGKMQYRYFYTLSEYAAYLKGRAKEKIDATKEKLKDINKNKEKILTDKINKGVNEIDKQYTKLTKDNKFMTDDYSYDKKIAEVKKSAEWRKIVRNKDPEYVKYNKETGKYEADIDSYLAKKKHPGLDIADDIVMGRKVSVNKVEKDAMVAGVADYAKTYVALAALGTKFLLEKFKFSQGSYKEEKQAAVDYAVQNKDKIIQTAEMVDKASSDPAVMQMVSEGEKYIKQYGDSVRYVDVENLPKSANISKEDYDQIRKDYDRVVSDIEKASSAASATAKNYQNGGTSTSKPKTVPKEDPRRGEASAPETKTSKPKTVPKEDPRRGQQEEDHKYVEKIKVGNGYRYFYSEEEYEAYKKEKEKEDAVSNMTKNAKYT